MSKIIASIGISVASFIAVAGGLHMSVRNASEDPNAVASSPVATELMAVELQHTTGESVNQPVSLATRVHVSQPRHEQDSTTRTDEPEEKTPNLKELIGRAEQAWANRNRQAIVDAKRQVEQLPGSSGNTMVQAWRLQAQIEREFTSCSAIPENINSVQKLRRLIQQAKPQYPFRGRIRVIRADIHSRLLQSIEQTNPGRIRRCIELLAEAESWRAEFDMRSRAARPVISRLKQKLGEAYASLRRRPYSPERIEKAVERIDAIIELASRLEEYDRGLARMIQARPEVPEDPIADRRKVSRRGRSVQAKTPAECIYIEVAPVILDYWSGPYLSAVSGTVTNRGERPLKNVVLRVYVQFHRFRRQFVVKVADSEIEPGETSTWKMHDIGEDLPNSQDPIISASVIAAQFSDRRD